MSNDNKCDWCNREIKSVHAGSGSAKYCSEYCLAEGENDMPIGAGRSKTIVRLRKSDYYREDRDG